MNHNDTTKPIAILWDDSYIWGLLVWRAIEALGLPYELVKGEEIAHGFLSCKCPEVLLVPGGTARHKAAALGKNGMAEIRNYVAQGGHYIGFVVVLVLDSQESMVFVFALGEEPPLPIDATFCFRHIHVSVKNDHPLV